MTPLYTLSPQTSRDLATLARQLKAIDPEARKALPKRLKAAAQIVQAEANTLKPSSQIRISTSAKLTGRDGAKVQVVAKSSKRPPLAGLLEAGNKGSSSTTSFRHPVFGDRDVWVRQPTHPYLAPAGQRKAAAAQAEIAKVIDDLAKVIDAH